MSIHKLCIWLSVYFFAAFAIGAVLPAAAQDATPEATPAATVEAPAPEPTVEPIPLPTANDSGVLVVVAVFAVIVALFGGAIVYLAQQLKDTIPQWAVELIADNRDWIDARVDAGFDTLDEIAGRTPTALDDELTAYIREQVYLRLNEVLTPTATEPTPTPHR